MWAAGQTITSRSGRPTWYSLDLAFGLIRGTTRRDCGLARVLWQLRCSSEEAGYATAEEEARTASRAGNVGLMDPVVAVIVLVLVIAVVGGTAIMASINRDEEQERKATDKVSRLGSGKTPLMHWAAVGDEDKVQMLLDDGADLRAVDADGDGVLRYAMGTRNVRLFELLLTRGADANARRTSAAGVPGFTILHALAESGWSDGISALARHGANVEARGPGGTTAMMLAAGGGRNEAVTALHSLGANVNARDDEGDSVLYYAASRGHWRTTKLLLSLGANANPPAGLPGRTPIVMAAALAGPTSQRPPGSTVADFEKVVVELLRAGADASAMYDAGYALQRSVNGGIEIPPVERVNQLVAAHDSWGIIYLTPEGRSQLFTSRSAGATLNQQGPQPIAAFSGNMFGPRLPLRLIPPGYQIGSREPLGRAMQAAEQRASDGDVGALLEAAVWWLTISACEIQDGQYQGAREDFMFAHRDFVWHSRAGGPATAWKDVRHAAAWFNHALASWKDGQFDRAITSLDAAVRLLEGVTDPNDQDSSYYTVKTAVTDLERRI
ncbi:MAG: ankyrin repeat domain-containing protein [Actinobacteria bacterium]|nr:ankyrin repeat domain-containing protein [Actinomycetota bacterium]